MQHAKLVVHSHPYKIDPLAIITALQEQCAPGATLQVRSTPGP